MTAPEYDFTVTRHDDHIHVRGFRWADVVEVFSVEAATNIARDLADSPDDADRQLARTMLAACGGGAT